MGNSDLMCGKKIVPITLYVSVKFYEVLERNWNFKKFPLTARLKPCLKTKTSVPFKDKTDFITTILRKEFLKSKIKFNWDMEVNNPDF